MTAVKTQLITPDEARAVPFQPTATITATDVQEAIEEVEGIASAAAPGDAVYIVGSAHADLSAERVATDTATIDVDLGTAAQAKWNVLEVPGIAATGMVVRTAAATYTARTITGTANEISVANGDGVSGNPTLSLPTAIILTGKTLDEVEQLGINTTADSTNRLSVNSDAVLFNHNGTTSQVKVNKNATANTASHLFQVGFSGRAEFGLIGSDDFQMKTSPDGSAFTTGLTISNSTAAVSIPVSTTTPLVQGGTGAGDDIRITSTSDATKGTINLGSATTGVFIDEVNSRLSIGENETTMTVNGASFGSKLAAHAESATEAMLEGHSHTDTAAWGAVLYGARSRGTAALPTIVSSGDELLRLAAVGYDGTDYALSAELLFEVDGTPGANDMPGRIRFLTAADGGQTPAEAMRINSDQSVQISSVIRPDANDGAALGTATVSWSDLFLASGAVINAANGDAAITHSAGVWTVSTGDWRITTAGTNAASAVTVGGTQTLTAKTLTNPDLSTSYLQAAEISTPTNPAANSLRIYAKDVAGVTKLHTLDSAGTETELGAGGGGGGFTSVVVQTFTASGTYTPTSGMEYCIIEVQASGGGGGGGDGTLGVGAGGGGGEYARGVFDAATVGASQAVTINAVGTAGSNTGGDGGGGGSVSVGALITANGGSGGPGSGSNSSAAKVIVGGAGGTGGTGGTVRIPGGQGGTAFMFTDGGGAVSIRLSGHGGAAHLGFGGANLITPDTAGTAGQNYGGGGSGGVDDDATGSTGGAGGPGFVVVTEFIA